MNGSLVKNGVSLVIDEWLKVPDNLTSQACLSTISDAYSSELSLRMATA